MWKRNPILPVIISHNYHLTSIIALEVSATDLNDILKKDRLSFYLDDCNILILSLIFFSFIMVYLDVRFFFFVPLGIH